MPAVSAKQRRFMGAELARSRAGKRTKTKMSQGQLEEFATMKHGKHKKMEMHDKDMDAKMKKRRGKMPMSKMPAGASQSPSGDIGAKRQEESEKAGGFKTGAIVRASSEF